MTDKLIKSLPLCLASATMLLPGCAPSSEKNGKGRTQKPNIVFILADDMGIGDLGCYGQERILTPNIDRLAENGIRFTHHYSGSTVSAPSRCALMTGKDMGHAWIRGNKGAGDGFDSALRNEEKTVAELLKEAGYATACVGKWGLGGPGTEGSPINQGFDYFFGYLGQGAAHDYYPKHLFENERKVLLNGEVYSHFMIVEKGLDFIRRHTDEPFFAYFAVTPPHADLDYPDLSAYSGKFEEVPHVNNPSNGSRGYKSQPEPRAAYASMVSEVDRNVGQILTLLEEKGILDNTIVIFSSDNGVHQVGGHDPDYFNCNGPFRGYKRDLYEGGIRTPFVVSWPAVVEAGRESDHISTFWDFMPTVCDIVGIDVPEDSNGISYYPVLQGKKQKEQHDHIYYEFFERGGKQSIMTADGWKLVRLNMNNPSKIKEELYKVDEDIAETNNLAAQYPEKVSELRDMAMNYRTESELFKWGQNNKK